MGVKNFFTKLVTLGGGRKSVREHVAIERDPTKDYKRRRLFFAPEISIEQLPPFSVRRARMMMRDPQVKIGMATRNAALLQAEIEVETDNAAVKQWVEQQWEFLWNHHFEKLVRGKRYGYAALQIDWEEKSGQIVISGVKEFAPEDSRALTHGGVVVGFSVKRSVRLFAPRALWLTYNSEFGNPYGDAILRGSYGSWWEKWMDRGAKATMQLRMLKDAYRGDAINYPVNKTYELPTGEQIPARDLAREIQENALAGATIAMPSEFDANGNKLWEYTQAKDTGSPTGIIEWLNSLNLEIWKSLDVFPEVIEAAETGSGFSGRSVPFVLFISSTQTEFNQILEAIDAFVLRPGVTLNFGAGADYKIKAKPLVETFAQDMSGTAMGGGAMGGQSDGQAPPTVREPQRRGSTKFISAGQFSEGNGQPDRLSQSQFAVGPTDSTNTNADELIEIGSAVARQRMRSHADALISSLKKKRQI